MVKQMKNLKPFFEESKVRDEMVDEMNYEMNWEMVDEMVDGR